jgi:hypothetical protein
MNTEARRSIYPNSSLCTHPSIHPVSHCFVLPCQKKNTSISYESPSHTMLSHPPRFQFSSVQFFCTCSLRSDSAIAPLAGCYCTSNVLSSAGHIAPAIHRHSTFMALERESTNYGISFPKVSHFTYHAFKCRFIAIQVNCPKCFL